MFINEKILIKLMKRAQKSSGVYIGRWDGWYVICGGYWKARIAVGRLPRSVAAAMVELSGNIPQEGEAWTADKEKNQLEGFSKWENAEGVGPCFVRPVWVATPGGTPLRVLQLNDGTCLTFRDEHVAAALYAIDTSTQESQKDGPHWDGDRGAVWQTNQAAWHIYSMRYDEMSDILDLLAEQPLEYTEP